MGTVHARTKHRNDGLIQLQTAQEMPSSLLMIWPHGILISTVTDFSAITSAFFTGLTSRTARNQAQCTP